MEKTKTYKEMVEQGIWNPNPKGYSKIKEISKLGPGPKTDEGKLILAACKYKGKSLQKKFEKAGLSLVAFKAFSYFLRMQETKGLTEIVRLENLINLLESDLATRAIDKIEKGLPLNPTDLKQIRILKESIEALHKMKYGEKKINLTASYADIQKMMFSEDKGEETERKDPGITQMHERNVENLRKEQFEERKRLKEELKKKEQEVQNEPIRQDLDRS